MIKKHMAAFLLVLLTSTSINAMDFSISGNWVFATGNVTSGDGQRLKSLVQAQPLDEHGFRDVGGVSLHSPGGDLDGGMALGRAIRNLALETRIEARNTCASACALAFLGGVRQYATGIGVHREIEKGGRLGFHGFRFSDDYWEVSANIGIEITQLINGLVLDYASEMGGIDLGFLAETLSVSSQDMLWVNTPESIVALGITVQGIDHWPNNKWGTNICRGAVAKRLNPAQKSRAEQLVFPASREFSTEGELLELVLSLTYASDKWASLKEALREMSADQALRVFGIYTFSPNGLQGSISRLDRGGGFYYNYCIAVIVNSGTAYSLLIDPWGEMQFWDRAGRFGHMSPNQLLW